MLVLEIGPGPNPQAHKMPRWEGATVETMELDPVFEPTYLCDARTPPEELNGKYDGILASHILEHIAYRDTQPTLDAWARLLAPKGELHVLVPSLEWAAIQLLSDNPSPATLGNIFGGQNTEWDFHRSGFTMRLLRSMFDRTGLATRVAKTGLFQIGVGETIFDVEQHYVMGVKHGSNSA